MNAPRVERVGEYLITAKTPAYSCSAVLNNWGWSVAWRDRRDRLRWTSVPTVDAAARTLHALCVMACT